MIQIQNVFFCSCVQKEKCQTNKLGTRNDLLDGLLDGLLVSQAENASCPDIDMVCCNGLDVITPDTRNLCSLHSDIFYRYITKLLQCTNTYSHGYFEIQVTKFR